jgi:hypothetical protein
MSENYVAAQSVFEKGLIFFPGDPEMTAMLKKRLKSRQRR